MIRIGIVGVGFMGMIHYLAARKLQWREGDGPLQSGREEAGRRLAVDSGELWAARGDDGPVGRQEVSSSSTTCSPTPTSI